MTAQMESFDYIPDTCDDILSEIGTYVLLDGEDMLINSDDSNNNCKDSANNNLNILEKSKPRDGSNRSNFNIKAKRGRPCAKPPTKEILRRRRKVGYTFCLSFLFMFNIGCYDWGGCYDYGCLHHKSHN